MVHISRTPLSNLARMAQSLRGLYYWPIGEHSDSRLSAAIELSPEYVSMHVWWLPGSNNSTCQSSEVQPPAHFPQSAPLARYGPRSWVHTSKKSYSDPIPWRITRRAGLKIYFDSLGLFSFCCGKEVLASSYSASRPNHPARFFSLTQQFFRTRTFKQTSPCSFASSWAF
jgi:hypothetical protein